MFRTSLKRHTLVLSALVLTTACGDDGTAVTTDDTGTGTTGDETPTTLTTGGPTSGPDSLDDTTTDADATDTDATDTGEETCGNGEIDRSEQCDGENLGRMSCEREGYDSGTLSCTAECTFDTSACCNDGCGSEGDTQCNGDAIEVCSVGDNGCLAWVEDTDCSATNEYCDETRGDASCLPVCVDQCDADGDTRCDGDIIETCSVRTEGCLGWVSGDDCTATDQYCDDTEGAAACVCDDECTTEGALQCAPDDDAVEACEVAANGCLEWTVETTCAGEETCDDGGGDPVCAVPSLYCIPTYAVGCDGGEGGDGGDEIDDFTIVDANDDIVLEHLETGCSPDAYADFTGDASLLITLEPLETYDFTITHNYSSQRVKIWIDFDEDGAFDDATELLFESPSGANPTNGSFLVPGTLDVPITTRMRVMDRWLTTPTDACDPGGDWGETHDYTVEILDTGVSCANFEAAVTEVTPANGATSTTLSPTLTVVFDTPVATDVGIIDVTGNMGTNLSYDLSTSPAAVSFSNEDHTMTIALGQALPPEEEVTVDWSGLEDTVCGNAVPAVPWTFDILVPPCTPGMNGMVGTSMTTISTDLPSFTERYLAVDDDATGWVYVGGTTALHRVPKVGGVSENVTTAAGLSSAELGHAMLVNGSDIFTLEAKGLGTDGHVWRISTDGGTTWDVEDYAAMPAVPGDWLQSITAYGTDVFVMTNEISAGADTEILSLPASGALPVPAALELGFVELRCSGIAVDDANFYVACGTNDVLLRVDRATAEVTLITSDLPLDVDANAVHAHDVDSDGSADFLYVKSGTKNVYFVCDPGGATPYVDQLVSYGATTSTSSFGLGFDPVANRLYAYDDGPRDIVVIE